MQRKSRKQGIKDGNIQKRHRKAKKQQKEILQLKSKTEMKILLVVSKADLGEQSIKNM